jgi:hypothetical protein
VHEVKKAKLNIRIGSIKPAIIFFILNHIY